MWFLADVIGLFSINVVSFSRNVVLGDPLRRCASRHATVARVIFTRRPIVPHLAVVAFTVIAIILILIFVRFEKRFAKRVYLALDALIVVFLIALIFICFRFSTS